MESIAEALPKPAGFEVRDDELRNGVEAAWVDVAGAFRFIHGHAARWGIDTDRMAIEVRAATIREPEKLARRFAAQLGTTEISTGR